MFQDLILLIKRISVLSIAAFSLVASGCDRKPEHRGKPVEPQRTETNTADGKKALTVPIVPNPSFEQGTDGKPIGWSGVGKVAWTQGDAADGSHYVSVSSGAPPKQEAGIGGEISWLSDPVSLVPGVAYELRFRCRYRPEVLFTSSQAFVGPECARQLIPLDASEVVSPFRSCSVRFVAPADPQRIFLGAYQLKGSIEYDNIELFPIKLAQSSVGGVLLGEGETITGNRYDFKAPFDIKAFRNVSRALVSCNNVFHDNRWRFSKPGDAVVYRHELAGRKQLWAELSLTTMFHEDSSWALGVEVSNDGKEFRRVATLKKGDSGKVTIPADMLPASALWVRLCNDTTENSKPVFFQLPVYQYSAMMDGAPLQAAGRTAAMTVLGEEPAIAVQPLVPDSLKPVFAVKVSNLGNKPVQLNPELLVRFGSQSEKKLTATPVNLPPGKTAEVSIPYEMAYPGPYGVEFSLGKNSATRLATTFYQPILNADEATRYGKLLDVPAAISGGLTTYTTDPVPIAARRQELARAIEKLTNASTKPQ
jgi:hypothetical protein